MAITNDTVVRIFTSCGWSSGPLNMFAACWLITELILIWCLVGYCTRRISRLRKTLKIPQGDKRHYKKRDVTVVHLDGSAKAIGPEGDERYLYIPLMLAERSWSYAMQLRQESNTEPRKKFHLVAKLRKACKYALELQSISVASTRLDAKTKLEAEAYIANMHGYLHFELVNISRSKAILLYVVCSPTSLSYCVVML